VSAVDVRPVLRLVTPPLPETLAILRRDYPTAVIVVDGTPEDAA